MMRRAVRIINETINDLDVDISGKVVLTEVGSKNYLYTPIIASLSGASEVYAVAKNSRYGLAKDIIAECLTYCEKLQIKNIKFLEEDIPNTVLAQADIICNSGNLRPINEDKLKHCKQSVVIPLMYEAWEFRAQDVDLSYCKIKNIKVAGTWENHPKIKVFNYCGMLAVKMALEAGFEITGNNIIVWSDDHFGEVISQKFKDEKASVIQTVQIADFYNNLASVDFVFLADYDESGKYFGKDGIFDIKKIKELNPDISFIHLYGNIDIEFINSNNISIFPQQNGHAQVMTYTLGHVGLIPILRLQVAGLKVAQEMIANNYSPISQIL